MIVCACGSRGVYCVFTHMYMYEHSATPPSAYTLISHFLCQCMCSYTQGKCTHVCMLEIVFMYVCVCTCEPIHTDGPSVHGERWNH